MKQKYINNIIESSLDIPGKVLTRIQYCNLVTFLFFRGLLANAMPKNNFIAQCFSLNFGFSSNLAVQKIGCCEIRHWVKLEALGSQKGIKRGNYGCCGAMCWVTLAEKMQMLFQY
jgi:hypothetical protein